MIQWYADLVLTTVLVAVLAMGVAWCGGQALGIQHPVMDHQFDPQKAAQYEAAVARAMAMSESELLAFVPEWTYVQYCECPHCYGGVEGNGIFTWTIDRPAEMTCRFCGTVYPNERFPETEVLTGQNALGETIALPYHKGSQADAPHFLSLHLQLLRRRWLEQQCDALGRAYAATGKEDYARRVALILDRFATRYPHYPVMQNLPRRIAFREQKAPWPWDSGRWNFFHNNIPISLLPAYDLTYASPEYDRLSGERGYDVREHIEKDFLEVTCEEIMLRADHVNNCVGYDVRSAAILGRVINRPRYVHWAYYWMRRNLTEGFMRDGFWKEGTPAYHAMTVGGLEYAFAAVRGYSDPPGYTDPEDGVRFDDLDPDRDFPFWARCKDAPAVLAHPNGMDACIHDTHPYAYRWPQREATVSTICPAMGHASLGRGRGPHQMQAQLHFSGGYGHQHYDNCNLTLWAKGKEMLPDLGYTWTQMRWWTTSTIGHNLVVVDRLNQRHSPSDGSLLAYYPGNLQDPESLDIAVVEADGKLGYQNVPDLDLYQRLLVTVPVSAAEAYVVDVFRVRGGQLHDWALHGDADEDTTAVCDLPFGEPAATMLLPTEEWVEPTQEAHQYPPYGMLRDMRSAPVEGGVTLDFVYAGEGAPRYRLHMLPAGPAELWLGRAPSVRRMGQGSAGDMRKAYDFWMPMMLLRRTGAPPLTSVFVAVHEPHVATPFIQDVQPLALQPSSPLATALEVRHGDTVDTIISTADEAPYPARATASGLTLRGKLAIVRQVGGQVTAAWLFDGEQLSGRDFSLELEPSGYSGAITGSSRLADGQAADALLTASSLPLGDTLQGRWLILTLPNGMTQGHEISRVVAGADGQTAIVTAHDHGLRVTEAAVEETYFPLRKLSGTCRYHIAGMASIREEAKGLLRTEALGKLQISWPGQ